MSAGDVRCRENAISREEEGGTTFSCRLVYVNFLENMLFPRHITVVARLEERWGQNPSTKSLPHQSSKKCFFFSFVLLLNPISSNSGTALLSLQHNKRSHQSDGNCFVAANGSVAGVLDASNSSSTKKCGWGPSFFVIFPLRKIQYIRIPSRAAANTEKATKTRRLNNLEAAKSLLHFHFCRRQQLSSPAETYYAP